jgi:Flp pilus assembly protein TadG
VRSEQGAILIHVALALTVLAALSIFVIDYGVLWVSRRVTPTPAAAGRPRL